MRRLWGLATIAWMGVVAHADPRVEADCATAASDPGCADVAAALATPVGFDRGRTQLTALAQATLDSVVTALSAHETLRLRIVGHFAADTPGQVEIAKRRAEVVKWYLIDNGIVTDRIDTTVSAAIASGKPVELQLATPEAAGSPQTGSDRDQLARDASEMASILTNDSAAQRTTAPINLGQQIAEARNQRVTIGGDGDSVGFRDDRSRTVDTDNALGLDTRHRTISASTPKPSEGFLGRTPSGPIAADLIPPPPEVGRMLVTRYLPGLSRCYRKSLASDSGLSGRVGLTFGIDATGKLVDPAADGLEPELDSCILSLMTSWRFPISHARGRARAADARFSVSLALQAN